MVFLSWRDKKFSFSSVSDPWACERPFILCDKFDQYDVLSTYCISVSPASAIVPLIFGADFVESWKYPLPHIFFILLLSSAPQNTLLMFLPSLLPLTTMFCDKSYSCSQHAKFAVILNNHLLSPQSATSSLISLFFGCLFWLALSHGAIRKSCFTSHATAMLIQKTGLQPKRCYFFPSPPPSLFFFSQKKFYVTKCCVRRRTAGCMRTHGFSFHLCHKSTMTHWASRYSPNLLSGINARAVEVA